MLRSLPRLLLPVLGAIAFSATLGAQCATMTASFFPDDTAAGFMFDVRNQSNEAVHVTGLDSFFAVYGTTTMNVYTKAGTAVGFENTPAAWTSLGSADVVHAPGVATDLGVPMDLAIAPGAAQAFFVHAVGTATVHAQLSTNIYVGMGPWIGTDGTLTALWVCSKASWAAPSGGARGWNGRVHYCKPARNEVIGAGCGGAGNSLCQFFANAAQASAALSGNTLDLHRTLDGYTGTWTAGNASAVYSTPPASATVLATGDDGFVAYTLPSSLQTPYGLKSTLAISGNGIVAFGPSTTSSYTPAPATFLAEANGGVYAWHDYNVLEGGSVKVHQLGSYVFVTWQNIESFPSTAANPSTLQFRFNLANGDIRLNFLAIDGNTGSLWGSAHLIGVSAPGASNDPGSVNLATAPLVTADPENVPLALLPLNTPIRGTPWFLQTDDLPMTTAFGITIIGLGDPGIDDLAAIGMPNCGLRATLDILSAFVPSPGATQYDWSLYVPDDSTLLGVSVFATSAVATDPATNAFGLVTSNGVHGTVGYF